MRIHNLSAAMARSTSAYACARVSTASVILGGKLEWVAIANFETTLLEDDGDYLVIL
jgi:hypothetical protein